jgi:hypothetical protein
METEVINILEMPTVDTSETAIPMDKAEEKVASGSGEMITKNGYMDILKDRKVKELEFIIKNSVEEETNRDKTLARLQIARDNNLTQAEKQFDDQLAKAKENYMNQVTQIKNAKIEELKKVESLYTQNSTKVQNDFKTKDMGYSSKSEEVRKEISRLEAAKLVKEEVKQQKEGAKIEVTSGKTLFEYIDRNKTLDGVVMQLSFIDALSTYIKALEKGVPFGVEQRIQDYLLKVALEDKDVDGEMLEPVIRNKKINELKSAYDSIIEYKQKR